MKVEEFAVPAAVVEDRPDFDLRRRRTGGSEVSEGCDGKAGALVASGSLDAGQTAVEVVCQVTQRPRLTPKIHVNVHIFSKRLWVNPWLISSGEKGRKAGRLVEKGWRRQSGLREGEKMGEKEKEKGKREAW